MAEITEDMIEAAAKSLNQSHAPLLGMTPEVEYEPWEYEAARAALVAATGVAPPPDRDKLIDKLREDVHYGTPCTLTAKQALDLALTAPVEVDREKLTEILRPYDPDTPMDAALAIIERMGEWLGGGER